MIKGSSEATVGAADAQLRTDADGLMPQAWSDLIVQRCGLTFRHVRLPEVIAIVRAQIRVSGIAGEAAYYRLLCSQTGAGSEWEALIERLTNHETSFFRHPPSFDGLRMHILPALRAAKPPGARLSLWSAGCSTGQEAYSIAMSAMDDANHTDFTVWGSDISHQAIKVARQGSYGPRAIATIPERYRQRFLQALETATGSEWQMNEEIRKRVRFMTTNLVEPDGFRPTHDVVMCHNVLIYFSPAAVTRAVTWLASCVAPGGYLLLGPGEAPHDRPAGLEPVVIGGVRAFQRRRGLTKEARS